MSLPPIYRQQPYPVAPPPALVLRQPDAAQPPVPQRASTVAGARIYAASSQPNEQRTPLPRRTGYIHPLPAPAEGNGFYPPAMAEQPLPLMPLPTVRFPLLEQDRAAAAAMSAPTGNHELPPLPTTDELSPQFWFVSAPPQEVAAAAMSAPPVSHALPSLQTDDGLTPLSWFVSTQPQQIAAAASAETHGVASIEQRVAALETKLWKLSYAVHRNKRSLQNQIDWLRNHPGSQGANPS